MGLRHPVFVFPCACPRAVEEREKEGEIKREREKEGETKREGEKREETQREREKRETEGECER